MALLKSAIIFFLGMAALQVSIATVYKVGDSAGWTAMGTVDYKKWAAEKNFHVGDIILFTYNAQYHNVKQVSHDDFKSCNASNPLATYTTGNDSITIKKPGHLFFLCGFPGHCEAGQKVDIRVSRGSSMAPSPSPSDAMAPGPSHNSAPSHHLKGLLGQLGLALAIVVVCLSGFAY
ncbi:hypothetical protein HHK36_020624 [Tetracentron sinense]|uniref:Phytocyanin domain-containing protein n=1 Tax=Tetracentron sinense TaxID=13715 RepID=A0A834YZB6_TETSI|nr:hypothetical protein HHK36_020624 [Tetracentron sinense]